ncbi:MAG: transcriptional regulator [Acetobacteraceae bacterium]|nr:transcriptional regulator [Acetobacteraceae bacterium]
MTLHVEMPADLQDRVDAFAARSNLSASDVIADALENGHSIEWQQHFVDRIAAGSAAADRAEFASEADIEGVLNKYRPA